jgi:uncharacterized repeat protein (TIGR01451 family)
MRPTTIASIVVAIALAVAGTLATAPAAYAATDGVITATTTVAHDGTGQGTAAACSITGAGGDNSAHDGVVCTNDTVGYQWNYSVTSATTPTTATFVQTVPAGVTFDSTDATVCENGTGYTGAGALTTNPDGSQTLTCTITFDAGQSLSGSLPITVKVSGNVANGTVLDPVLTTTQTGQAPQISAPAPVTVRAEPSANLVKGEQSNGNITYNGVYGYAVMISYYGFQGGTTNKGIAALASPIAWTDNIAAMTPGTQLMLGVLAGGAESVSNTNCRSNFAFNTPDSGNVAEGTLECEQPGGPGTAINLSLTGADTAGDATTHSFPQRADATTILSGGFMVFVPLTDIPTGASADILTDQFTGFDPKSLAGQSNFGTGHEPGGTAGDTCTNFVGQVGTTPNDNCANLPLTNGTGNGPSGLAKSIENPATCFNGVTTITTAVAQTCYPFPAPSDGVGDNGEVAPGQQVDDVLQAIGPGGGSVANNYVACDMWDPSQQQIDPTRTVSAFSPVTFGNYPAADYTVEYTNRAYTYTGATPTATTSGCGISGDTTTDGPWFSSIVAAGGPANVTGVRVTDLLPFRSPDYFSVGVPLVNVETASGVQPFDFYSIRWDENTGQVAPISTTDSKSSYIQRANYLVVADVAGITKTSSATSVTAGQPITYTLKPSLSSAGSAVPAPEVVTVVDTLDACLQSPTFDASTLANWTITSTPTTAGPDGNVCTDGTGETLTFASDAAITPNATIPPIGYTARASLNAPDNYQATNTAIVSTPHTIVSEPVVSRTAAVTVTVRASSQIGISKTVDNPVVEVNPDQIGWTVTWSNNSATDAGRTQWIDVLPYNGDGRGTSMHGALNPVAATLVGNTTGVSLEYTNAASPSINSDPNGVSNSGSTTWCTQPQFGLAGCPTSFSTVTGIRVTVADFAVGDAGGFHVLAGPTGNHGGDVYTNNTGKGRGGNLAQPVPVSNDATVTVVSSSVGSTVWWDYNNDGTQNSSEPGIADAVVKLYDQNGTFVESTTTDANGTYSFDNLHSGSYAVKVDPSTLPTGATASYDLKDGVSQAADSDSGGFALGINTGRVDVNFGYRPAPGVTTVATPNSSAPGSPVSDTATITGTDGAMGTLSWSLIGPVAPINGSCTAVSWIGVPVIDSGTALVLEDGDIVTGPSTPAEVGCYTYVDTLDGTSWIGGTTAAGIASETVLVKAPAPAVHLPVVSG